MTGKKQPCRRQAPSNAKVNCKQHDKAGTRVSGAVGDLAFRDVSISLLARSVQLSAPLFVMKDTRPIRAYRIWGWWWGPQVALGRFFFLYMKIRRENTEDYVTRS